MTLQYILVSLSFVATVVGIAAGLFPRAKAIIAIIAFLIALGALLGNLLVLKAETITMKEARCERAVAQISGLMSVKNRVRLGVAMEMTKIDPDEVAAQMALRRFPKNLNAYDFERRLHFALSGKILTFHMGNVDVSYEKFLKDQTNALEEVGSNGCQLSWRDPPEGRFQCECSLYGTVNF